MTSANWPSGADAVKRLMDTAEPDSMPQTIPLERL